MIDEASVDSPKPDPMPSELLRECLAAKQQGADFPKIWQTILRDHPLVSGLPVQAWRDERPHLEIPLGTGHWIIHDTARNDYVLWPEIRHSR